MVRTGKPCSTGSGRPFIATASIASRSSVSADERRAAGPAVLGGLQHRVGLRARRRPRPSRSASRTPLHQALPIRSPPTGLDTQLSVTQASVSRAVDQVLEAQHELAVDHAVDPQPPLLRRRSSGSRWRCGSGRSRRPASPTATRRRSPIRALGGTRGSRDPGQPQQRRARPPPRGGRARRAGPSPVSPSASTATAAGAEQEAAPRRRRRPRSPSGAAPCAAAAVSRSRVTTQVTKPTASGRYATGDGRLARTATASTPTAGQAAERDERQRPPARPPASRCRRRRGRAAAGSRRPAAACRSGRAAGSPTRRAAPGAELRRRARRRRRPGSRGSRAASATK